MPTPARTTSPFETIEKLTKKATQPVSRAAADVAGDVAESLGFGRTVEEKSQIKTGEAAKLNQIRQNLARINQEIDEARKKREHPSKPDQALPAKEQMKKFEEKQQKESVLQKLLKSRSGTKEAMPRASG